MAIPDRIRAGVTAAASISLPSYASADGWAVSILLQGAAAQSVSMSDSGGGEWSATFVAATTASWAAGSYRAYVQAVKSAEKFIVAEGAFLILPVVTGAKVNSTWETQLAAIDAAIAAVVNGNGVKSYQIDTIAGKRQLERMTLAELREHRNWVERKLNAELETQGLKPKTAWRPIGTRFTR